jgi:hypothetical protein
MNPPWIRIALAAAVAAAVLAGSVQRIALGALAHPEWLVGWSLAAAQGVIALAINRHAVGKDTGLFLLWGLGAQLLRVGFLAAILVALARGTGLHTTALVAATLTGYLVFLVAEIVQLHRSSTEATAPIQGH